MDTKRVGVLRRRSDLQRRLRFRNNGCRALTGPFVILVVAVAATGCDADQAIAGGSDGSGTSSELHTKVTVALGAPTALSIRAVPDGTCDLRWEGAEASQTFLADDEGIVRVSLELRDFGGGDLSAVHTFHLVCADEGNGRYSHQVDVRIAPPNNELTSSSNMVAIGDFPMASESRMLRAPLSGDPAIVPQEDLVRLGYPPRPDPITSPAEYSDWLALAALPLRIVSGRPKEIQGRYHAPMIGTNTSSIWSGFVVKQPGVTYRQVSATWRVPTVISTGLPCIPTFQSVMWVGIDGYNTNDLIQDGTGQDIGGFLHSGICVYTTRYYSWIEYFPNALTIVSSLLVGPGDLVQATAWSGDVNGNPSATGAFGWFNLVNITRGTTFSGKIARPGGTTFVGNTAEWIMERPTLGSTPQRLANYGGVLPVRVGSMAALVMGSGTVHNLATDSSVQVTMMNGSSTMSTVAMVNQQTEDFTWVNWQ